MRTPVPVMSPLLSYDWRGASALRVHCGRRKTLRARRVCAIARWGTPHRVSRDLSSLAHSLRARRHRVLAGAFLVLLASAAIADDATSPQFVILRLPASTMLIVAASVIAGLALGLVLAVVFLRAADATAARYHRALIADILDRSSIIHQLVHEIVANANARIALLRLELDTLKETQP